MDDMQSSDDPVAVDRRRRPGRPARLQRDEIVRAAVRIADARGIDAVTMRSVAHDLGAEAMSLYRHVENKEALVDGMVDLVYGEIELPDLEAPWPSALRDRAISARAALVRHPWAIPLMESRSRPGPMNLGHHEAMLALLYRDGHSGATATRVVNVIDSYVYGFALQEHALPVATPDDLAAVADQILAGMPPDTYPLLARTARELIADGFDYRAEFEAGLDLVVDALAARVGPAGG